ncbi:MAG TPA: hypothetical protein VFE63_02910 [Roseiarcus sp.]|nr:hypothetical protein [Roseiarcus sp.]
MSLDPQNKDPRMDSRIGDDRSRRKAVASADFRWGTIYSIGTAVLLATQEPFSALAAKSLSPVYFICVTQTALLFSVPLLMARRQTRHDLSVMFSTFQNLGRLAVLFIIGLTGLLLYNFGLRNAHPIIIAAILNMSPFWAALVAKIVSGKAIPVSPVLFCTCFLTAFAGAMLIAWSQSNPSSGSPGVFLGGFIHGSWKYAIPIPVLFALSGTLVGHWFHDVEEAAAISANFIVSAGVLIPSTLLAAHLWSVPAIDGDSKTAVALLLIGTLAAAAAGRVFYQIALTATNNDNGFVTMFFLLVPGLSSFISFPLSWWISVLHFDKSPIFFAGLTVVAASLFVFSLRSW